MRPIPTKLRSQLAADPFYKVCARAGPDCHGRITWEHALLWGGKQLNKPWAIIPLCMRHHLGAGLDKRLNQKIALNRATPEDLEPHAYFQQLKKYLNK